MNRIDELFSRKKKDILAVYFTAGFPANENCTSTIVELEEAGVDLVEVGMPFSDPLADGQVIQESSAQSLKNGMTLNRLFEELRTLRVSTNIPVVLMGYLNPILQFGPEQFLSNCKKCGIDGLILPDLPAEEYEANYRRLFEQYGIYPVFLITTRTPKERMEYLESLSKGFVYLVSSSSITGNKNELTSEQRVMLKTSCEQVTTLPVLVGFGIHDQKSFEAATEFANGGIIGTLFIREQVATGNSRMAIKQLMQKLNTEIYDHSAV